MNVETIKAYDLYTSGYDAETAQFWQNFPPRMIRNFAGWIGNDLVVSIGTGPGRDARLLREAGVNSLVCLDAAISCAKITNHAGFASVQADFMHLPFPDKTFCGAWAYTSLIHTPKTYLQPALVEINRILKTGGILGLGMIEGQGSLDVVTDGVPQPRHFTFYSVDELVSSLKAASFHPFYYEQYQPGSTRKYLHFLAKKLK